MCIRDSVCSAIFPSLLFFLFANLLFLHFLFLQNKHLRAFVIPLNAVATFPLKYFSPITQLLHHNFLNRNLQKVNYVWGVYLRFRESIVGKPVRNVLVDCCFLLKPVHYKLLERENQYWSFFHFF